MISKPPKCNCVGCLEEAEATAQEHFKTSRQPTKSNIMIVELIEKYASLINLCLDSLVITDQEPGDSVRKLRRNQALEDNDLFQKTTLFELRRSFE
jgi:hypothetical protein